MLLDKSSPIPLYFQLAEEMKSKIKNGNWQINKLIPSEAELCKKYEISRGTVRQAVSELIKDGLAYRKQGYGTFVAKAGAVWPVSSFYCFGKETEKNNIKPTREIIKKSIIFPEEFVRKAMNLTEETKIYKIVCLVSINHTPVALETSCLLRELFPKLDQRNLAAIALYENLIKKYNLKITRVREAFEPVLSNKLDSEKLKIPLNSLSLLVKRTAWTGNIIFEYRTTIIKGDKCHYLIELI